VKAVQKALESLPGVEVQQVTVGTASVSYDDAATSAAIIRDAIEDAGYTVTAGA
jgi:copper chaperone CopZ